MTAYNFSDYLREAINSVVAQTFTDFELIVVDDGSDEDLAWVPTVDPRVSLVRQRNQGVAAARNRGIAASRARFIAFLDQDDRWRPTKLERQVELLRAGSVFCHTAYDVMDADGTPIGLGCGEETSYLSMLAGRFGVLLSSSIVDRPVLHRVGVFDPRFRVVEDVDLFLRMSRRYEISYVPTAEVDYRRHAGNSSNNWWRAGRELLDLYAREARLASARNDAAAILMIREVEPRYRRFLCNKCISKARLAARMHRRLSAVTQLVRATTISPRIVLRKMVLATSRMFLRRRFSL